ncbi:MAG: hypothetical protein NW217_02795 [Hyphomicrobiaceae bacterium]|nr:hypothetical protein [Hyphomicrobiaceae bacterium]
MTTWRETAVAQNRTLTGSLVGGLLGLAGVVALLIIEALAAMIAYVGLALWSQSFFGYLVSLSRDLLNVLTDALVYFFPDQANTAFATLLGELGPKSILLLILGLVVGALVRLVLWTVKGALRSAT